MRRIISTIVCVACAAMAFAQSVWLPAGVQQLAGTYSRHFQHVFTGMHNQAALAQVSTLSAGAYMERRFMLQATSLYALALALPTHSGTFSVSMQRFGYAAFNQQKLGLAYGRALGEKVSIGIQADHLSMSMQQYGRAGVVTFEAGCLFHITARLHAGIHAFNPPGRQLDKGGHRDIPVVYTAGAGYEVSTDLLVSAEVMREEGQPLSTRVMCEYNVLSRLSVQAGLSTASQQSGAAVSYAVGKMRIYVSGSYHPQLGITPAVAVIWRSAEKQEQP